MRIIKSFITALLITSFTGCVPRPPKLTKPPTPAIIGIPYTLEEYRADEKAFNDAIAANKPDVAKAARDRAVWGLLFVINNNYQSYAQGLAALRSSAGLASDVAQSALAAASNIFTNVATKNLLSASLLGVKGITGSVQSRYYLDVSPEVIILSMDARRKPRLDAVYANIAKDAGAYPLNQARAELADLFWAGTLEGARLQLTEQAGKTATEK